MNLCGGKFVPSDVRAAAKASATKISAEKITALKAAYKLAAVDAAIMSAVEEFEPGVLNEEDSLGPRRIRSWRSCWRCAARKNLNACARTARTKRQ